MFQILSLPAVILTGVRRTQYSVAQLSFFEFWPVCHGSCRSDCFLIGLLWVGLLRPYSYSHQCEPL